jgi:glycosyltransferase involved in cell wall biosynthesis
MVVAVLSRLALDPNLLAAMGQAARRRYEAGFSADDMWRNYLNLYQNLYEEQHGVI